MRQNTNSRGQITKKYDYIYTQVYIYEFCPESISGLPLYLRAGVILHHRAGGLLQSNPHLIAHDSMNALARYRGEEVSHRTHASNS